MANAYTIELTSLAWKQVGRLSSSDFADIRTALSNVAEKASNMAHGSDPLRGDTEERVISAGAHRVVYARDDHRRVIFVVTIMQDVQPAERVD